eukprot:Gregarina_sp_Poly_1__4481@NODE_240_length_10883_cov_144_711446_g211_i0_p5_GENE_NODE_240_length_10883_cov_144_711446_g211_i0NODE_240_length_10883_cov_144_711446_g211_i0_p5_ORF_typecomplete_len297_score42_65PPTA/PF01239_22/1_9e02PPTA/PF01239_22/1_3e05PPTA/PF01239_22/0_022PPTA/PF01239_22/6_1e06DUF2315/PF10231_9/0_1DUF2315/PF10231_9/1_6e03DUF4034/PF13226_6/0_22DUF4034/PF13226_6/4e03DUF4034/PF13226_6/2_3e03_NODE_240_length_10883_cov_144_711446_g211_i068977787
MTQAQPFIQIHITDEQNTIFQQLARFVESKLYEQQPAEGLLIAANAIAINNSNYTAGWLRRRCLEQQNDTALINEVKGFTRTWLEQAPKSYQAWYHREWLMKRIQNVSKEFLEDDLANVAEHLDDDSKNHCAWQYRQAIICHFKLPLEPEYEFVENLMLSDCRNNSAWTYRQWLCSLAAPELQNDIRKRETKYVAMWIRRTPTNEACFHYLMGMFQDPISKFPAHLPPLSQIHQTARDVIFELASASEPSSLILEMKAAILMAEGKNNEAKNVCTTLRSDLDPVRAGYFEWLALNC